MFFIWRKLNPSHPRMLCVKIGWNWLSEENVVISSMNFRFFVIISPWKRAGPLNWKIESPSPKDALRQVWLKLAQWFWRKRFLNCVNVFSLFRNYLPLEKGGTFIIQTWIPFTKGCFVPCLVEICPVALEKKIF